MALSRKMLSGMGLTAEQVDAIIDEHTSVTQALIADRDKYKADAEKLPELQKQLEGVKGAEDFKAKYEAEHKAFDDYRQQVKADAELLKVKNAYRAVLKDEKISEKRLDAVIRLTDFSGMKLDGDGNLVDEENLRKAIRGEWSDYIVSTRTEREQVATPPGGTDNAKLTREDIYKRDEHGRYVYSTEERQKLIAENPQAFR